MNLKMLLPTYRTRFKSLMQSLASLSDQLDQGEERVFLNLGCGEGDFDRYIAQHFSYGVGCDINESDIAFCRSQAGELPVEYFVADAHALKFEANQFDCIICIDVIEHTEDPAQVVMEIARILKPSGHAIISFPRLEFPTLYDPINRLLNLWSKHLPIGAYSFGHNKLVSDAEFMQWIGVAQLEVVSRRSISGPLVALLECYWVGLIQKLLKPNYSNQPGKSNSELKLRPSQGIPTGVFITDWLIKQDKALFSAPARSIGSIYVVKKPEQN